MSDPKLPNIESDGEGGYRELPGAGQPDEQTVKLYVCPTHGVLPRWQGGPFCGEAIMGGRCEEHPKPEHFVPVSQLELALSRIGELEGRLQEAEKELAQAEDEMTNGKTASAEFIDARVRAALAHLRTEGGPDA